MCQRLSAAAPEIFAQEHLRTAAMVLHIVKGKGGRAKGAKSSKGATKKAFKPKRLAGDVKEGKAKIFPVAKRELHPKLARVSLG